MTNQILLTSDRLVNQDIRTHIRRLSPQAKRILLDRLHTYQGGRKS